MLAIHFITHVWPINTASAPEEAPQKATYTLTVTKLVYDIIELTVQALEYFSGFWKEN